MSASTTLPLQENAERIGMNEDERTPGLERPPGPSCCRTRPASVDRLRERFGPDYRCIGCPAAVEMSVAA